MVGCKLIDFDPQQGKNEFLFFTVFHKHFFTLFGIKKNLHSNEW
jgi:hypothetical protein